MKTTSQNALFAILLAMAGHVGCNQSKTEPGYVPAGRTTEGRRESVAPVTPAEERSSAGSGNVCLTIHLPKPQFTGTPKDIRSPNLEPARGCKPRPPIDVPAGADKVLSKDCKVTSSDPEPIIGELAFITDGDKEHDAATYVELGPGTQWVQVDLGKEKVIYAACVWHYHGEARVYSDVVCQISNDPDFIDGVVTVFNNDHDNSSKLGEGKEKEYIETNEGRPFAVNGVKGRYVRFSSKGNTSNEMNHYTEVEVYGKP